MLTGNLLMPVSSYKILVPFGHDFRPDIQTNSSFEKEHSFLKKRTASWVPKIYRYYKIVASLHTKFEYFAT